MRKPTPIKDLRRARTLNQEKLARLVGISQQYLSKIEKGQLVPTPDVQVRIAAILGASRDELFPSTEAVA